MNSLEEIIETPMSDNIIKKYLPDAKIITTQDLLNINHIDELFNKKNFIDYVIILFLDGPNKGHWTCLSKYGCDNNKDIIEFFDSYGKTPKDVYKYAPMIERKKLGTDKNKLCDLLNECDYDVIYNPIDYQSENSEISVNTCGRHCCFRIINLIGQGWALPEYYDYMKAAKEHFKEPYDIIVSKLINL